VAYYENHKDGGWRRRWLGLIALVAVALVAVSYFFANDSRSEKAPMIRVLNDSAGETKTLADSVQIAQKKTKVHQRPALTVQQNQDQKAVGENRGKTKAFVKKQESTISGSTTPKARSIDGFYEVASVAHFYNAPHEQARRKEFINYWNQSFASIKPLREKNGFVYVVFKYPSGKISNGWLRKKDLKKVNELYANNKE
jgi:hypothetical protein